MTIRTDDGAYRRGVVFGFTVAEIVLLLVFCLLLLFMPLMLAEGGKAKPRDAAPDKVSLAKGLFLGANGALLGSNGLPLDAARRAAIERALADPSSTSDASAAPSAPLPEGWVKVVPGAASSVARRTANTGIPASASAAVSETASGAPSSDANVREGAARTEDVALTLDAVCAAFAIPREKCTVVNADEKVKLAGRHNWPPIIKLKEADGEFFTVGLAEVSPGFEAKIIQDVVPKILELTAKYQTDIVEIVGNTDEQPIQGMTSNLDGAVFDVLSRGEGAGRMRAADNAGLGFARAVAIVQILKRDSRLGGLTILPLSAAQMVDVDGRLSDGTRSGDVKERRRIEIRVRQGQAN